MQTGPTLVPVNTNGYPNPKSAQKDTFEAFSYDELKKAREARRLKVAGWDDLKLCQDFLDEDWMKNQIKPAGLRTPKQNKPPTVSRLCAMLRRANTIGVEVRKGIGTNLTGYLKLNPQLPLCAALTLVMEAINK